MPRGATLLGLCDDQAWITAGCGERLAVLSDGEQVLMARAPVRTAVRLAPAGELRLAGCCGRRLANGSPRAPG